LFTQLAPRRFIVTVLALLGQLTPAVVAPVYAIVRPKATVGGGLSGCAPTTCACPVIEKVTKGCCCSKPEPAPEPKPAATACEAKPTKTQAEVVLLWRRYRTRGDAKRSEIRTESHGCRSVYGSGADIRPQVFVRPLTDRHNR